MRTFLSANWHKLMTGSTLLIFSLGFMVFVLKDNTTQAGIPNTNNVNSFSPTDSNLWIVGWNAGIYEVTWSKAWGYNAKKIWPKN